MTEHDLKVVPPLFDFVASGCKTFEVRRDDRGFQSGDTLLLREWTGPGDEYTGRWMRRVITYVLREGEQFGVMPGFVVLGMKPGDPARP